MSSPSGCDARDTVAVGLCAADSVCGDRDAFCAGQAPVLTDDGARCAVEVAAEAFATALCSCRSFTGNDALTVDSFDSRDGPYVGSTGAGDMGVVGKIETNGALAVTGSLRVEGSDGVRSGPTLAVGGDLECAGPLDASAGGVEIAGDAAVNGDLSAAALSIGGTLTVPEGAVVDVAGATSVGDTVRGPVVVEPPCRCDAGELIDVAAIVALHADANDNAAAGFDPAVIEDAGGGPATVELPCGRLYARQVESAGDLRLVVNGRTALFVAGNLNFDSDFAIELGEAGELDVFVAGNINFSGDVALGDPRRPRALRLYTGRVGAINAAGQLAFAANLYAPLTDLVVSGGGELFGAAFVSSLLASAPVELHYDRSITADTAGAPGSSCAP